MEQQNQKKISKVIFLLGGPGSGKGTQSQMLIKQFDLIFFSAGQLLRQQRKKGSQLGKKIQECCLQGKIVPVIKFNQSQITVRLIKQAMQKQNYQVKNPNKTTKKHFLIDGFPRNFQNNKIWQSQLKDNIQIDFVLYLNCDKDVLIQRVLQRSKNSGRFDDNIDTLNKRLESHFKETLPVVEYFRKEGKLRQVDASIPADDVYQNIKPLLKGYPKRQ